ncbi:MAG TPA: hypothetical protein VJA21_34310 [Verrucomicrobiae bacterium]
MRFLAFTAAFLLVPGAAPPAASLPLRGNLGMHDPSTIIKCKDTYHIFGTGQGIISKSSTADIFSQAGPQNDH